MNTTSISFKINNRDKSPEDLAIEQLVRDWYRMSQQRGLKELTIDAVSDDGAVKTSTTYRIDDLILHSPNDYEQVVTFAVSKKFENSSGTTYTENTHNTNTTTE